MNAERPSLFRIEDLGELEILAASYRDYRFAEHSHAEYVIAVTDGGRASFRYRRAGRLAGPDSILVHHPGEPHSGGPISGGSWSYRAVYVPESLMKRAIDSDPSSRAPVPFFGAEVLHDSTLAGLLRRFHHSVVLRKSNLACEFYLMKALMRLVRRHSKAQEMSLPALGQAPAFRAREFLDAHADENIGISALARAAGVSPFHLIRLFQKEFGVTPHVYQTVQRIRHAKELLRTGLPIADVAAQTGFYDQAHFTKVFKSHAGVTPGSYVVLS